MAYFFYFFIFVIGACVGSFLNVLIIRLAGEEKITGRSKCPACGHKLAWHDLAPVFSFLWLRGKCRYCRKKISWQYPAVELSTGLIFFLIYVFLFLNGGQFDFSVFQLANFIFFLFIASCLIVVFVSDLKYFIIPDEIIIAGIVGWFAFSLFEIFSFGPPTGGWDSFGIWPSGWRTGFGIWQPFFAELICAAAASFFFFSIVFLTKGRGMGLGDVKFAFLMGLLLGWPGILAGLLLAFFAGAAFGLALILLGRASMKSELPFGVFLAASAFLIMIFEKKMDSLIAVFLF